MLRNRLLILLGGCFLTASAAWADDVGYVDCSNHPEETQVFAKARKTPEVVASLPCGERFSIVLYGFIFSRGQTRDGRVGYVYSNLISADRRAGASVAQPQPAPAEAAAPAIRAAETRTTWERPNPGGVRRVPLVELFGGYAFARFVSAGTATNFNGGLGSVGWNVKPWLQIVADSSYSVVTIIGVQHVLYGNHYGPRLFRRGRNRWGATPFVEALVGGSRANTTVSGAGGYTASVNSLSYKVGGGLDIHPSRRFAVRLFCIAYYPTSFR